MYAVLKRERYEKNEWHKGKKWARIADYFVILSINFVKMSTPEKKFYNEEELFQIRMNRTPEERYKILMQLIRMSRMIKNATIIPAKKN